VAPDQSIKKKHFPFLISNFSFVIASQTNLRLESGLVRLTEQGHKCPF